MYPIFILMYPLFLTGYHEELINEDGLYRNIIAGKKCQGMESRLKNQEYLTLLIDCAIL